MSASYSAITSPASWTNPNQVSEKNVGREWVHVASYLVLREDNEAEVT